jgi:hypothetical protein
MRNFGETDRGQLRLKLWVDMAGRLSKVRLVTSWAIATLAAYGSLAFLRDDSALPL